MRLQEVVREMHALEELKRQVFDSYTVQRLQGYEVDIDVVTCTQDSGAMTFEAVAKLKLNGELITVRVPLNLRVLKEPAECVRLVAEGFAKAMTRLLIEKFTAGRMP